MPADINWLLSSIAQASAAMIAIVGGLLVSRYVGLHAEQQATGRRLKDLTARATGARKRAARYLREMQELSAADLVDNPAVFEAIVRSEYDLPTSEVFRITGDSARDYEDDLVLGQLRAVTVELQKAGAALSSLVPSGEYHEDWETFRIAHPSLTFQHRNAWEWMYNTLCDAQQEAAENKLEPLMRALRNVNAVTWGRDDAPTVRLDTVRKRERLTALYEAANEEGTAAESEAVLAQEAYDLTRQPEGFSLALQVLVTLAILGIVPSVTLMGFGVATLDLLPRLILVGFFLGGVALLLRFLYVYARFLQQGGRATLPTKVWFELFESEKHANHAATKAAEAETN
ncbi:MULTISPECIES: hypothetical protein [Microbacterium]|uniref:Uncharacterized protein n=1 Tax=Microbacterium maritypicum MF109 TaxID=1333857 RepID=T5KDT9_MICMQ|nr:MULTISPECIES: hypothetical protein [Microbacterium]EQM73041.1 hypothetical protein L687_07125 [Microbacterium maritypicum MF109]NIG65227.1 hypothetical protein [Microbacterium sp. Be9]